MKENVVIILLYIAAVIFFAFKVGYGLGIAHQKEQPCSSAQCMSERLKGEESCWKYKK